MAGTYSIRVWHGASPGTPSADVSTATIRFKRADDDTQDANDPIPKPVAGSNYSWRKSLKLYSDVGPDNTLENLRFFSEGQALGAGRTILIAVSATYTQGSSGDESTPISAVDVDTYTTGAPLTINAGEVFSSGETGDGTQDFVVLQAAVDSTASPGNVTNAKGLVYRYDES